MATTLLRRLVSGQKRRFTADSFDLDLAYISPRIVAMGLPAAQGTEVLYRNPMAEVARFVRAYHPGGRAKVYNLCSEHSYGAELLLGGGSGGGAGSGGAAAPVPQLLHLPFDDHQVPPLAVVQQLCVDAAAWLAAHAEHVVFIHCKAGKGRTGVMVCCLLLYLSVNAPHLANLQRPPQQLQLASPGSDGRAQAPWHPWQVVQPVALEQLAQPPLDVLALYAQRRTIDGNGVTIASQRRYVCYFWSTLTAGPPPLGCLPQPRRLQLRQVCITGLAPGTADSCELIIEARPSGSTAARGSLVCVRAAPGARAAAGAAAAGRAGSSGGSSSMPGLCGVPCCVRPPLVQDDSCRISSGPDGDSLIFTIPAASQGLQALRAADTEPGAAAEACCDDAAEGGSCVVEGDVRLTVTRGGARLFYTWFHTAFLPPGSTYMLTRAQLDKPLKALPQQLQLSIRYVDSQPTVQPDAAEAWADSQQQQQQLWARFSEDGGGSRRSQEETAAGTAAVGGAHMQQQPAGGPFSDPQAAAAAAMASGAGMAMPAHTSDSTSESAPSSPQAHRLRNKSWRQFLVSSLSSTSAVLLGPGGCDAAAAAAAQGGEVDAWAALVGGKATAASKTWGWDSLSSAGAPDELIGSTPVRRSSSSGGGGSNPRRPAQLPATTTNAASKHQLNALLLPPPQQQQGQGTRHHRRHSTGLDGTECSLLDAADLEGTHATAAAAGGPATRSGRPSAPGAAIELQAVCRERGEDCQAPLRHLHPAAAPAAAAQAGWCVAGGPVACAAPALLDPLHSLLEALEWGADAPRQRWQQQQQQPDGPSGSSRMRSAPCSPAHGSSRRGGGKGLPPVSSSPALHQLPAASSAPATPAAARLSSPCQAGASSSRGLQALMPCADGTRSCRDQGRHSAAGPLQSDAVGSTATRGTAHGRPKWAAASLLGGCAEEEDEQEQGGDEAASSRSAARRSAGSVPDAAAAAADEYGRGPAAAPRSSKPPAAAAAVFSARRRSSVPGTSVQRGSRRASQDELLGLLAAAAADGGGGGDDGSSALLQPSASAPVGGLRAGGGSEAPAALTQEWRHLEKAWERSWWVA